jgi:hypothetical protein
LFQDGSQASGRSQCVRRSEADRGNFQASCRLNA